MIEICRNVQKQLDFFKIVPQGHHNCQLSIVNCQFGEAVKFQFIEPQNDTERVREETITHIQRTTCPPALPATAWLPGIREPKY